MNIIRIVPTPHVQCGLWLLTPQLNFIFFFPSGARMHNFRPVSFLNSSRWDMKNVCFQSLTATYNSPLARIVGSVGNRGQRQNKNEPDKWGERLGRTKAEQIFVGRWNAQLFPYFFASADSLRQIGARIMSVRQLRNTRTLCTQERSFR